MHNNNIIKLNKVRTNKVCTDNTSNDAQNGPVIKTKLARIDSIKSSARTCSVCLGYGNGQCYREGKEFNTQKEPNDTCDKCFPYWDT